MEPIAIIGMAGRFPGAADANALWELLRAKRDAVTDVPRDRWDVDAVYAPPPVGQGKMSTRWGGFVDRAVEFDAECFGISKREASFMDPQQRVVLEVVWEALEHAGIAPSSLSGTNTGVFVGVSNYDYNRLMCRDPKTMDAYSSTGTILAITANRVSYALNLRGPSIIVDTACSSSLVSVHLANQSLRLRECDIAVAGGVNLILAPEVTMILSQGGFMSPDGRCKTFDASANGYVRSEGCGMVVLRRLADAVRDGDEILAVVRGSAVNQDGGTNGLTAPSGSAQQAVIRRALADAGVAARDLSYVEAHGTGTPLGDIIEWRSLRAVLLEERALDQPCGIGSIKTNIGHAESAAGVAGLMKIILSMQHDALPAHIHLEKLNPHIRIDKTPLFIPTELTPWPSNGTPRLAGISSFGIGGTNAHMIIEEAPPRAAQSRGERRAVHLFPVSGKSAEAFRANLRSYEQFLAASPSLDLGDLCHTAAVARGHFPYRAVFRCESVADLHEQLAAHDGSAERVAKRDEGDPLRGDPDELAAAYARGAEVDWRALYPRGEHRLVSLPTYAFAGNRYWFTDVID